MSSNVVSLRSLIDKWLAPTPASPVRLTRFRYAAPRPTRCVRAESLLASGSLALIFFQHDDGSWCVFPPSSERPAMRAWLKAE
ncbi:hypothetical protein B0G80_5568 [Paraburkholderia sp. BL6669N2]|nr:MULTISPECIES: hypothetical protein [unclassified Paraburkholderia]REG49222.1 hypothetical protein B0G80_5568 [Paraburkholderia sp. BL6669N2]RKR36094.1 hypothetical protein B0G82_4115 [Paraburkholderia sp. BL17N1]TDY19929.1 hypothetical protein B0G81_0061 [Paraburkholderia sp. BL6665CI2N2]